VIRVRRLPAVLPMLIAAAILLALPAAATSAKGRPTCDGKRATIVGTAGDDISPAPRRGT
jgi:hypothetical protein